MKNCRISPCIELTKRRRSHPCSYKGGTCSEVTKRDPPTIHRSRGVPVSELMDVLASGLDRSWQRQANCMGVDPDLFFPERGASTREAKEVCRGCVVREDCLEFALVNGEKFGIWGGMSERERRRLRRQRAQAARSVLGA